MKRALVVAAGLLCLGALHPRFGGSLTVLVPPAALSDPERLDPARARAPQELEIARIVAEPLFTGAGEADLQPGLAQSLDGDPRARTRALRLAPGLSFAQGAPLGAKAVVKSLDRLTAPGSPYAALLLPLASGAAGLRAASDTEVDVTFDFAYPDWALGLRHPGTGITAGDASLTGAFAPSSRFALPEVALTANGECAPGRPFADALALRSAAPKVAARALASGAAAVSLVAVPEPKMVDGPLSVATYLVVNSAKPALAAVPRLAAAGLDRAELVRLFVHAPSAPLYGLLAPSVEPSPVSPASGPAPAPLSPGVTAELLVEAGNDEQRAVADRLQVKLHDLGVELRVAPLSRAELVQRQAGGNFDVALLSLPALPEPGLALAQVLLLAGQRDTARSELIGIGAIGDLPARRARARERARALAPSLSIVPLYAQGLQAALRADVHGLAFDTSGVFDLGQLWLEGGK